VTACGALGAELVVEPAGVHDPRTIPESRTVVVPNGPGAP
jgi:hypothetical protein